MKGLLSWGMGLVMVLTGFSPAFADRGLKVASTSRTALVIGNAAYKDAPLRNPVNDARDMATALKKSGFDVTLLTDADKRKMDEAIKAFGKNLRQGGAGLFYYAGHGIQLDGSNYLIPVDARIDSESDVRYHAVEAGWILGKMADADNDVNIIILDACRNNPFVRSFRSAEKGLAIMDAPRGSIIAYSTGPGSVAEDGKDRNGIFTGKLLKHLKKPNLKVEDVLKNTRMDVVAETGRRQTPWESSSLMGNFYFNTGGGDVTVIMNPSFESGSPAPVEKSTGGQSVTNSLGMAFVYIHPGTFMMGSPTDEPGRDDDETRHQVTLTREFYMQTNEVTQGQWQAVMGNNPSHFSNCGKDCPVENVSWDDVQEFIQALNRKEGKTYRLPTEAEWEYAARAGSTGRFCFGDSEIQLGGYAWYSENSGRKTHPVGQKHSNEWGLYDMHGNVWEWCQDWYDDYSTGIITDPVVINDPGGFLNPAGRVLRGGGWDNNAGLCRSAVRGRDLFLRGDDLGNAGLCRSAVRGRDLFLRGDDLGFRLVLLPGLR